LFSLEKKKKKKKQKQKEEDSPCVLVLGISSSHKMGACVWGFGIVKESWVDLRFAWGNGSFKKKITFYKT
jgi:hypothetical protein